MKRRIYGWTTDAAMLLGAACCAYGLWLAWRPLGFIVGGLAICTAAFLLNYGEIRKSGRG